MSAATNATGRPARAPISSAVRRSSVGVARDDRHLASGVGERLRAAATETLACRADERAPAGDAEIHLMLSPSGAPGAPWLVDVRLSCTTVPIASSRHAAIA